MADLRPTRSENHRPEAGTPCGWDWARHAGVNFQTRKSSSSMVSPSTACSAKRLLSIYLLACGRFYLGQLNINVRSYFTDVSPGHRTQWKNTLLVSLIPFASQGAYRESTKLAKGKGIRAAETNIMDSTDGWDDAAWVNISGSGMETNWLCRLTWTFD